MELSTKNPLQTNETDPFVIGGAPDAPTSSATTSSDWMTAKLDVGDSNNASQILPTYEIAPVESDQVVSTPTGGGGHGHDDHHGAVIAPTKVPEWLGNIIEKVFKVKKRGTTVEVRSTLCYSHSS